MYTAIFFIRLHTTRKYAYLPRVHRKDKLVARKLQVSGIFNFINLIMNRLIGGAPLRDFSNNTKCEVRNI